MHRRERVWSLLVASVIVGLMFWPIVGKRSRDSFPLSTYPMFTSDRARASVYRLLAVDESGDLSRAAAIEPRYVAGDEVLLAAMTIRRAARRGRPARMRLCREVARTLVGANAHLGATRIVLVKETHDSLAYFVDGPEAGERKVLAGCPIERGLLEES